ncbi:MAG TPA: transglutaminase-like domain-containing protein [Solirubrobacteraceae bacterium]|nr:transglutaminase-like domain-containing protein [Solirubrobacteraceae bacterium]
MSVVAARHWGPVAPSDAARPARPGVRLATFSALALYGMLRWETLLKPAPNGRMLALLALTIAVAACGWVLHDRRRWIAVAVTVVAVIVMFPIAGVPFTWIRHVRIEVTANAIGQGLTALPNVLVPYLGINHWVRVVIVLGAAVLLLDAAVLMAFTSRTAGELRRAGTALPLIALAVVPSTIVKPQFPYLQGLALFALLAAFMWAERAPAREGATAIVVLALAGVGGVFIAPRIDSHRAWFDYRAIASTLAPARIASFNWQQTYGPLVWPHHGTAVFEVQAARPEYWKTENLDGFDGRAWTDSGAAAVRGLGAISAASLQQWTETIQVTLRAMRTLNVIGAGTVSQPPTDVPSGAYPGISPGTWVADSPLHPGASYRVTTYSPTPTPEQLRTAGTAYPPSVRPYLKLVLKTTYSGESFPQPTYFPRFGSPLARVNAAPPFVTRSTYAPAYALARRLVSGAATPYAFVERVMAYLRNGYTYSTNPPAGQPDPLESFLFKTRVGYCQQFAGAMALLLRMGGVPARVSVGFTPGTYNSATHSWVVADTDAHAWVEAWFPSYGWVRFDPTPPTSGATGGTTSASSGANNRSGVAAAATAHTRAGSSAAVHSRHGGSVSALIVIGPVAVLLAALLGMLWLRRFAPGASEELVSELGRALRRSGRPVADGVTLAALERQLGGSPGAAAYVRAIRLGRYSDVRALPTGSQRRALRAALAGGRGALGRLRAWWALPPRRVRSDSDG